MKIGKFFLGLLILTILAGCTIGVGGVCVDDGICTLSEEAQGDCTDCKPPSTERVIPSIPFVESGYGNLNYLSQQFIESNAGQASKDLLSSQLGTVDFVYAGYAPIAINLGSDFGPRSIVVRVNTNSNNDALEMIGHIQNDSALKRFIFTVENVSGYKSYGGSRVITSTSGSATIITNVTMFQSNTNVYVIITDNANHGVIKTDYVSKYATKIFTEAPQVETPTVTSVCGNQIVESGETCDFGG
jgi:hypothetical protein